MKQITKIILDRDFYGANALHEEAVQQEADDRAYAEHVALMEKYEEDFHRRGMEKDASRNGCQSCECCGLCDRLDMEAEREAEEAMRFEMMEAKQGAIRAEASEAFRRANPLHVQDDSPVVVPEASLLFA